MKNSLLETLSKPITLTRSGTGIPASISPRSTPTVRESVTQNTPSKSSPRSAISRARCAPSRMPSRSTCWIRARSTGSPAPSERLQVGHGNVVDGSAEDPVAQDNHRMLHLEPLGVGLAHAGGGGEHEPVVLVVAGQGQGVQLVLPGGGLLDTHPEVAPFGGSDDFSRKPSVVGTACQPISNSLICTGQGRTDAVPPADQEHSVFLQSSEARLLLEPQVGWLEALLHSSQPDRSATPCNLCSASCSRRDSARARPGPAAGQSAPARLHRDGPSLPAQQRPRSGISGGRSACSPPPPGPPHTDSPRRADRGAGWACSRRR